MDKVKGFFGIDLGEFDLRLDRSSYRLGETIRGSFDFQLKKPRKAKKVWVKVQAIRTVKRQRRDAQGNLHSTSEEQVVYSDGCNLDGEREYHDGHYPFDFVIPSYIQGYDPPGMQAALDSLGGVYRDLAEGAWTLLQRTAAPNAPRADQIDWSVSAGLSFSVGVSPKRSVKIGMGRSAGHRAPEASAPPPPPAYTPPLPPAATRPAPSPSPAAQALCPTCQKPPPRPGAKFCSSCGTAMHLPAAPARCGCGEELDPADKFCTSCGAPAK